MRVESATTGVKPINGKRVKIKPTRYKSEVKRERELINVSESGYREEEDEELIYESQH